MKTQLKDLYGKRVTPGVRILLLVVIIFFGLNLAFNNPEKSKATDTDKVLVD